MDDRRFDAIARALGGAATRRSALGALLGLGLAGTAGPDAGAKKKRRKKCDPACGAGQTCVKGTCACDNGGTVCGASCCALGQRCESGQCTTTPAQCIAFGEACKDTGRPCCDGTVCASGQGGKADVACYRPAGVACGTTADCVYDSTCQDGVCIANPQPAPVPACDVCPNGCRFSTIEAAIAAAGDGFTITVAPGTYTPKPTYVVLGGSGGNQWVYLQVQGKTLTLQACDPEERPVISWPRVATGNDTQACLAVLNGGHVDLTGFELKQEPDLVTDPNRPFIGTAIGVGGSNSTGSITLTDVFINGTETGIVSGPGSKVTINEDVEVALFAGNALQESTAGDFTCNATVTFGQGAIQCDNYPTRPYTGCGCS